jgi:hypothetical protein
MSDPVSGAIPAEAASSPVPLAELPAWRSPHPADLPVR